MPIVLCATTHCGKPLGEVDVSMLTGRPRPVWKIRPGWTWVKGILERVDETYRQERSLVHEMIGQEVIPIGTRFSPRGMDIFREADLPLCVRCPHCHRPRWVSAGLEIRPNSDVALVRP
jgi:hypothetical protein